MTLFFGFIKASAPLTKMYNRLNVTGMGQCVCVCVVCARVWLCVVAAAAMGHLVELGSVKVSCTAVMLRGCDVDMKVLNKLDLLKVNTPCSAIPTFCRMTWF